MRWCCVAFVGACAVAPVGGAELSGADIYAQRCAVCHDASSGDSRIPTRAVLRAMSVPNVLKALEAGVMQQQGVGLSAGEKRSVSEFVTGKTLDAETASTPQNMCTNVSQGFSTAGAHWNGWSPDAENTRFQSTEMAGLTAAEVPRLKLKWAFGFANTAATNAQPSVVGGRVFVASLNRNVYSLDARSGCQYWSYATESTVRTAIRVVDSGTASSPQAAYQVAYFGDARANVYAVDARSGALIWKVKIDEHPNARIIGSPAYYKNKLFVPLAAAEEGPATDPKFECCTARGSLVALDATTGKQLWKTYTIDEPAKVTGKNAVGTKRWGPSGASIWSAPTIDADRNIVYVGTGDNFSHPATPRSDAIVAFDMQSGKILWASQVTKNDVYNNGCIAADQTNCPESAGPDYDFGSSPILIKLPGGKRMLLAGQKSGIAYGFDPDRRGKVLWQTRVGQGGIVGGIQFGPATDGRNLYVAVSDLKYLSAPGKGFVGTDPKVGGGLYALSVHTGKLVWSAPKPVCGDWAGCSPAQSAAVTVIPGAAFSGSMDGHLRAYSTATGEVIWDVDTAQEYTSVNGIPTKGGSLNAPGVAVVGGTLFVVSGYGGGGKSGNVLLAFSVDGK